MPASNVDMRRILAAKNMEQSLGRRSPLLQTDDEVARMMRGADVPSNGGATTNPNASTAQIARGSDFPVPPGTTTPGPAYNQPVAPPPAPVSSVMRGSDYQPQVYQPQGNPSAPVDSIARGSDYVGGPSGQNAPYSPPAPAPQPMPPPSYYNSGSATPTTGQVVTEANGDQYEIRPDGTRRLIWSPSW